MHKALLIYLFGRDEPGLSLALGFLKAYADVDEDVRKHWDIEIYHDYDDTDPREVLRVIERSGADLVGFSTYSWNIAAVRKAAGGLPKKDKPLVVLGGVEVSPQPVAVLKRDRNADVIVVGEGEETFAELLKKLATSGEPRRCADLGDIQGLVWRDGRSIRTNPNRPPIKDLNTIPSPYLAGSYGDYLKKVETVPLETARGCPYQCTFCFEPRGFSLMRAFDTQRVKDEVELLAKIGTPEIEFFDTQINYHKKRAVELLNYLHQVRKKIRFRFELRAELLDDRQVKALAPLQFFAEIGLQSTHRKALDSVKRTWHIEKFEKGVKALLDESLYRPCSYSALSGILIDVMVGLPYDTKEDILESFDYAFGLGPSRVAVSITKILPGTELYDDHKKYGYRFDPDNDYIIQSTPWLPRQEIQELIHFKYTVDLALNKLHALRTIAWMSEELGQKPSAIFMEIAEHLAKNDKLWESYTVPDLKAVLAAICERHGNADAAKKVSSKLGLETSLNLLQNVKEKRKSPPARALFGAGYRVLTALGLPPLPKFHPASEKAQPIAREELCL